LRLVLGQHGNAAQARINAVGEREVDDAHRAGERDRGLRAVIRQLLQAAATTTRQQQRVGLLS
jgi:hypothetical protein